MPAASTRSVVARAAASAVSGSLSLLAFPPYDQVWLMPFGLAGLMVMVRGAAAAAASVRAAFSASASCFR